MPKKTRQEKIIAQLRRLQKLQEAPVTSRSKTKMVTTNEPEPTGAGQISLGDLAASTKPTPTSLRTPSLNYSYVFSDLRKTLIFAAGAITFEVTLSLTASSLYANLISRLF